MDERLTEVEAMAVRNSRILALGTNDEIRFLAGPNTELLDAKGRRVLPGLIDGHTHPHMWAIAHRLGAEGELTANRYNDPQLKIALAKGIDGAEVLRELERVVRQRAQELGPGKWILAAVFGGDTIARIQKDRPSTVYTTGRSRWNHNHRILGYARAQQSARGVGE